MEHRWDERIKVDLAVQIAAQPGVPHTARMQNLSLSGASIRTDFDIQPWTRVEVTIAIPLKPGAQPSVLAAYVTRCTKDGVGVEWCDYAPATVSELMQALNPPRAGATRLRTAERVNRRLEALFLKHDG